MRKFCYWGVALILVLASCASPITGLKVLGDPSLPSLAPDESRLVFRLNDSSRVNYGYDLNTIGYLVVQLHSNNHQSSKFASATMSGGVATVTIPGLVAGPWELLVAFYDFDGINGSGWLSSPTSGVQPFLLYTSAREINVTPGQSQNVSLLLYKPGDLEGFTLTEAKMVNSVEIAPVAPLVTIPSTVLAESAPFQVAATARASDNSTASTDQTFSWYSDNPNVAMVDNAGNVFPKAPGTTKIIARSRESERFGTNKFAEFTLTVEPNIVGYWKYQPPAMSYYYLMKITSENGGLVARRIQIDSGMAPQLSWGAMTATGANSWSLNLSSSFDFSTGTQTSSGMSNGTVSLVGLNQIIVDFSAMPNTFTRIPNAKAVTTLTLPTFGTTKTGQVISSLDVVGPSDAMLKLVYFSSSGVMTTPLAGNSSISLDTAGTVTVMARSIENPSLVASKTYNVSLTPPIPSSLAATYPDNTSVTLGWNYTNPGGLPGVRVERSTDGVAFTTLTVEPTLSTYTDSGLSVATQYYYRLTAVGDGSTYLDSLPTKILSIYTPESDGTAVIVSGAVFNPGTTWSEKADGTLVPSYYSSMGMGNYGAQGYDASGSEIATTQWLRVGSYTFMVYSLPMGAAPQGTVVVRWEDGGSSPTEYFLSGITKVYSLSWLDATTLSVTGQGGTSNLTPWNDSPSYIFGNL